MSEIVCGCACSEVVFLCLVWCDKKSFCRVLCYESACISFVRFFIFLFLPCPMRIFSRFLHSNRKKPLKTTKTPKTLCFVSMDVLHEVRDQTSSLLRFTTSCSSSSPSSLSSENTQEPRARSRSMSRYMCVSVTVCVTVRDQITSSLVVFGRCGGALWSSGMRNA